MSKPMMYSRMSSEDRKKIPLASGAFDYFPDALAEIALISFMGSEQHNPGQPLHWDRTKSTDHADCALRHFMERGTRDLDGMRHTGKSAWRNLALLQLEIEDDIKHGRALSPFDKVSPLVVPPVTTIRMKPRVYITGPNNHPPGTINRSFNQSKKIAEKLGFNVLCPSYTSTSSKSGSMHDANIKADLDAVLSLSNTHHDKLAVMPGWSYCHSCVTLVSLAKWRAIPVVKADSTFNVEIQYA